MAEWFALAHPESTRSGRRWLRRALIAVVTVAATIAATIAGITYPWHSVGSPERLLQAVNVDLGSDGHVLGIAATNVHRAGKRTTHDTARYADTSSTPSLPVRVAVGYTMDGRSGHDLKQIVGQSGTIEVDVTVTNVTQDSQLVSYSDPTGTHQQYAPVAAPVTVVGTATLPADTASAVQAPPAPSTVAGDAASGVVQTTSTGGTAVQWATVLAPPRLAAAATFRLIETTANFQVPHFRIAAQAGMVTDPSTAGLLGLAFAGDPGTDAGRLVDLERDIATKIGSLQLQLADVSGQLAAVKNVLAGRPGQLGHATTARLAATTSSLRQHSAELSSALGTLSATLTATLGVTSPATQQLDVTAKLIADYIGVGSVQEPAPDLPSATCTPADLNQVKPAKTLLGELSLAVGQARAGDGASPGCVGAISAELDTVIGPANPKDCPPTSNALVCNLAATSTALETLSEDIDAAQAQSLAHLDPTYQTTVANDIAKLTQAVTVAQGQADGLLPATGPTSAKQLAAAVEHVQTRIRDAASLLSSEQAGLGHDLKAVHDAALADIATLGPGSGASSIADQIAELDNRICNPPSDMSSGLDLDYVAVLNALVSGGNCNGTLNRSASDALFGTPLSIRVSTLRSALSTVLAQTDVSSGSGTGLAADFAPLRQRLSSIDSDLGSIVSDLSKRTVSTGTLADNLAKVVTDLDSLYDAKATAASCTGSSSASLPLNILTEDFKKLTCRADAGVADVTALLGKLKVKQGKKSAHLTTGDTGTGTGTGTGAGQGSTVDSLVAGLSAALRTNAVHAPRTVDPGLRQGVAAFDTSMRGAVDVQPAATDQLRQLAAIVLNSLGPQGPQTPDSSALMRAQIRQGLTDALSLPAFDVQQPAGSTHAAVYVFTLGSG